MSIVIVLSTKDRLLGMSDSRCYNRDRTAFTDNTPKVFAKGPYLFVMGGAAKLVHDAWRHVDPMPGESAVSVTERLLQQMTGRVPPGYTGEEIVCFGIHRFGAPTEGVAINLRATHGQPRIDVRTCQRVTGTYVCLVDWHGSTKEEAKQLIDGELNPGITHGPSEGEMLTLAETAILSVAARARSVGGPRHAVVIDHAGMRWGQRCTTH
jgi:hypothetical protein